MKLSARNQLAGKVTKVDVGQITAKVVLDVGGGNTIAAIISKEAVEELGLAAGDEATAIIKATEVMVAK
ncbi:MAG: TOBE domain-containing protein [Thermoleophilia bacterium]|nr:TOBE domain-containing protein [Thermoleophilia bacterium]